MIRRIFCVLLISLGAGLDSYFYVFRFRADGTELPIALAAAVALEILLAFAVWNAQKSRIFTAVAVAITLYAVVQTSAGQTFSLLARDAAAGDISATTGKLIEEEKRNLDRLDGEYAIITKQLSSIRTVEDRAAYGVTVGRMTARLSEIAKERKDSSTRLSALAAENGKSEISRVMKMSIYDFYASMPGWSGMEWLKFIFHTFFSILIALMTPVGILTWEVRSASRILRKSSLTEKEVTEWVSRCWYKPRLGTSKVILTEQIFVENCERDNVVISPNVYAECFKRAVALGIITREGVVVIRDEKLIREKILKGR